MQREDIVIIMIFYLLLLQSGTFLDMGVSVKVWRVGSMNWSRFAVSGVRVILCITGPDSWPPSDLFSEVAGELSKVPRVTLKRDAGGVASTEPLEKQVDRVLREKQASVE